MNRNIFALLTAMGLQAGCASSDGSLLTPKDFQAAYQNDPDSYLLDVRTPGEYVSGHIEGAGLLDFNSGAAFQKGISALDKDKTYYIYCHSGNRSGQAARYMKSQGLNVVELQGGIMAWSMAGMPLVR